MIKRKCLTMIAVGVLASTALFSADAKAAPVDVDVTFVVDSSGSMGGEFNFLGGAISGFLTDLEADSRIDTAQAALVEYTAGARLVQDMTSDPSALSAAFNTVSTGGGVENAYSAIDAAITDLGISYRPNSVKSIILITDEDADDFFGYSNSHATGSAVADMQALLSATGFLNNIIYDFGDSTTFPAIAVPNGAVFDIGNFRTNREAFFKRFTAAKIQEIHRATSVPAPSVIALFGMALVALGAVTRRRQT